MAARQLRTHGPAASQQGREVGTHGPGEIMPLGKGILRRLAQKSIRPPDHKHIHLQIDSRQNNRQNNRRTNNSVSISPVPQLENTLKTEDMGQRRILTPPDLVYRGPHLQHTTEEMRQNQRHTHNPGSMLHVPRAEHMGRSSHLSLNGAHSREGRYKPRHESHTTVGYNFDDSDHRSGMKDSGERNSLRKSLAESERSPQETGKHFSEHRDQNRKLTSTEQNLKRENKKIRTVDLKDLGL